MYVSKTYHTGIIIPMHILIIDCANYSTDVFSNYSDYNYFNSTMAEYPVLTITKYR